MKLIFKAIVGSQAYGTSVPTSDIDYKGIFVEDIDKVLGFGYKQQYEVSKDETYYEVARFLQLLKSGNPTVLELLFSPEDCIQIDSPEYRVIWEHRQKFLTTQCANSFAGYAVQQIKKAKGLDKKMNWEKSRIERKELIDFCYIYENGKTLPLSTYLKREELLQEYCGLVRLDHIRDCYALYYDFQAQYGKENDTARPIVPLGYRGISGPDSNEVRLSNVPKYSDPICLMYFNKDGYSIHCKDYREYQEWLATRNTSRYVDTQTHGQKVDGKNLMHCVRLLDTAYEIATEKTINIRRPNAAELLKIRRGEVKLEELIEKCDARIAELDGLFAKSGLPEEVDPVLLHEILLYIRKM